MNKNIRSFPVLPHSNHYVWTRVGYFLLKFLCTKHKIEGNIISVQLILLSKGKKPSQNSRQRWGSTLSIHQSRGLHVNFHCVKNVQIRSFFWSVFSRIRTEYGPEKTLYLDTFHAVFCMDSWKIAWASTWYVILCLHATDITKNFHFQ